MKGQLVASCKRGRNYTTTRLEEDGFKRVIAPRAQDSSLQVNDAKEKVTSSLPRRYIPAYRAVNIWQGVLNIIFPRIEQLQTV